MARNEKMLSQKRVSPQEAARIPSLVCLTCGDIHQPEKKTPQETCGTLIKFLNCDIVSHHLAAYTLVSKWKPGDSCPQSTYACKGTLLDSGVTRPCPGRLTEKK